MTVRVARPLCSGLGKVERQARDFTPALRQIRKSFYRAAERQQFASEGGGDWRPDTPRTLARKAKRGEDARVDARVWCAVSGVGARAGPWRCR
jgi:hypothetical protein